MSPNLGSPLQVKYPLGDEVPISYVPYLIFLSYVVSLIGAITTVELLHRRVSRSGWRAWIQIGGCSVSFGLVAIWCMHFVGNRAIILGDGEQEIQLYYSASYTTVSAILPIVVIFLGLLTTDRLYKGSRRSLTRYCSLLICGVCGGAAVTEMHYLGNNGTTNYRLRLSWPHVVGAAAIAVGACLISFALFFHWSSHWMNNIWRRLLVACFLAVAVSGMHWTAAVGTYYELRGYHGGSGQARNTNIIIALVLSLGACVVCFALGWLEQRHRKKVKDRAQQVVLALATFDDEGRILVTQGGLLPCQTITQQFHQRTFDEDFNTSHPVFQWLFRVSQNWTGIIELIPAMREHLHSTGYIRSNSSMGSVDTRGSFGSDDHSSYSATFRELFCVTAHEIAKTLDTSLQHLGSLYEEVLTTGTLVSKTTWKETNGSKGVITTDSASPKDIESGIANPIMFGKGQLLVLTKKVKTEEANRLQNAGYRFAHLDQIGDHLARSLQISRDDLDLSVNRMQQYCERESSVPMTGTYLATFLLQASPGVRGLNVIVPKLTPERLPLVQLSPNSLNSNQRRLLTFFNGLSLDACLTRIAQRSGSTPEDDLFFDKFRDKIYQLLQEVPEPVLRQAVFSAQQLDLAHGMTRQNKPSQATVFAFCGIKEVYSQSLESPFLKFIPLSFFRTYLRTYPGCPDHAILSQKNHKEFSAFMSASSDAKSTRSRKSKSSQWWRRRVRSQSPDSSLKPDNSSEKGLVNISANLNDSVINNSHPFGGIMVSQDIVINEDHKDVLQMELRELGVRSEAGVADVERSTLADRLMAITASFRDPQATGPILSEFYQGHN